MNILSIVSAKGGVGKSTMVANLSVAFHEMGHPVLAVDLDPQNGLRFHFSFDAGSGPGLIHAHEQTLSSLIEPTSSGVHLLSYGQSNESERLAFEHGLRDEPDWFASRVKQLGLADDAIVVVDTPPGPSLYMTQALNAATVALAVVLPDAGSYLTLPQMTALFDTYCVGRDGFVDFGFVINQVDQSKALNRDAAAMMRASLKERVAGRVHQDQAVSEALAFGQSVLHYAPYSEAASDVRTCAKWVSHRLTAAGVLQ